MALVACSECGIEVSDSAPACAGCDATVRMCETNTTAAPESSSPSSIDSPTPRPAQSLPRRQPAAPKHHPIASAVQLFLRATDDYRELGLIAIPLLSKRRLKQMKNAVRRLDAFPRSDREDGSVVFTAEDVHAASDMIGAMRAADELLESNIARVATRSLFIGLFSEFDAFMGALIKALYTCKPELLRSIRREISLTELHEFPDLNAVKQDLLDKEIDTFRRQSYVEQFAELESKFSIKTLRAFPEWPEFVEMSQRRNLLTHNDGVANTQYFSVCDREGYTFTTRPPLGQQLTANVKYIDRAIHILRKTSFMLTHTLWRKLLPHENDAAHSEFNSTLYELLERKRWKSAAEYGEFGLTEPMLRKISEMDRRIRVVNTAIALKSLKKESRARSIMSAEDWSASIREFKLADAVLKEECHTAANLMREIGKSGEVINQLSYHQWPLFNFVRDRPEFQSAYEDVFGEPYFRKAAQDVKEKSAEIESVLENDAAAASNAPS